MPSVFPCCRREKPNTQYTTASWIERIVILGISNVPKGIFLTADGMDIYNHRFTAQTDIQILLLFSFILYDFPLGEFVALVAFFKRRDRAAHYLPPIVYERFIEERNGHWYGPLLARRRGGREGCCCFPLHVCQTVSCLVRV